MSMFVAGEVDHEPERLMTGHTVRVDFEQGLCRVCSGRALEGNVAGGLEWAGCRCCGLHWRVEDDGFALGPGRVVEEWT